VRKTNIFFSHERKFNSISYFSRLVAPNIRQKEFLKEGAVSVSQQVSQNS